MIPTLPSPRLDWEGYARCIYHTSVAAVRRLPIQWRGWTLKNQGLGHTVEEMHRQIERGAVSGVYDPQGTFDAFQGQSPQ